MGRLGSAAVLLTFAVAGNAYNPPVDTAGPLTVRIHDPSLGSYGAGGLVQLTRPGTAMVVEVTLLNAASAPLTGTLRLGVIDGWKVEPPAAEFRAPAGQSVELRYQVTAALKLYNADYPIHAYAEFDHEGRHYTAHPILMMEGRLANPPRGELPVEWKPVSVPANGVLGLQRLPVHREVSTCTTVGAPVTADETFQSAPAIAFDRSVRRGELRHAIAMHLGERGPSFRERIEETRVEYPLTLPDAKPLHLTFGTAIGDSGSAIFRVIVAPFANPSAGYTLLERTVDRPAWHSEEVDLDRFAGQSILLQLQARSEANTEALWAEPTLISGVPKEPERFPPESETGSRLLASTSRGYEIRLWPGRRGLLDATFGFRSGLKQLFFRGFHVRVIDDDVDAWNSASQVIELRDESASGSYRVRHRFRTWAGDYDLLGEASVSGPALRVRFWLENIPAAKPWLDFHIEQTSVGPWSRTPSRVYLGPGNVIVKPSAFTLGFDGHHLATSFAGFDFDNGPSIFQASDVPPLGIQVDPASHICSLMGAESQTITMIPAGTVWEPAIKEWPEMNGMRPAEGVSKLAGRFVFDLWSFEGGYGKAAEALGRAFRYGLTDSAVVWHNWQRWGYDYRLPDIYPPNPQGGTLDEFVELVELCRRNRVLFAPHDNYIDFYPDADGFSYEKIAFERNGEPKKAWFRAEFKAQSYRFRPDRLTPFVERNLDLIRDHLHPTAYFIDVWSSMAPYDYWTPDGRYFSGLATRDAWRETFAWIRNFLGDHAPQISEAGHDQLIGWLDGAQAQHLRVDAASTAGFTWKIQCADAERVPWFDAAHHDRFVLHGAGYPDRYAAGLDEAAHGIYSNDYITTEVLSGHSAMVANAFGRNVVRKYWLLHDLMRALALRRMEAFEFEGDIRRQHVKWEGGGEVWVNRGEADWRVAGHILPQYGFYARVQDARGPLEAAIERRDGKVIEWASSPSAIYRDGFRLTRDGMLTPLPESGAFTARLDLTAIPWATNQPRQAEALDEDGNSIRRFPLNLHDGAAILECEPSVFAYRLH